MRRLRHGLAAAGLAALLPLASAAPFSNGIVSGLPGEQVSPTVLDSQLVDFEGADLLLTFDPNVLQLLDVLPGSPFPGASIVLGLQVPDPLNNGLDQVQLSFAVANGPVSSNVDVTLLLGLFQILPTALPGLTTVHVETLDAALYDINLNLQVAVLALPNGVPEAGTGWLVLAAGGGLLVASRRRRPA